MDEKSHSRSVLYIIFIYIYQNKLDTFKVFSRHIHKAKFFSFINFSWVTKILLELNALTRSIN